MPYQVLLYCFRVVSALILFALQNQSDSTGSGVAHRVIPNADVYSYFEAKMTYLVFRMYLPHYALASFLATVLLSLPAPQSPFPVRHVHPAVYTRRSSYRENGRSVKFCFYLHLMRITIAFLRKYQTHYRSPAHALCSSVVVTPFVWVDRTACWHMRRYCSFRTTDTQQIPYPVRVPPTPA